MTSHLPELDDTAEIPLGKGAAIAHAEREGFGSGVPELRGTVFIKAIDPRRRRALFLIAALVGGICAPIIWFAPLANPGSSSAQQDRPRTSEPMRIAVVAATVDRPAEAVVVRKDPPKEAAVVAKKEKEPSRIIEFSQQKEIHLDPRTYLYASQSHRQYLPEFGHAPLEREISPRVSADQLSAVAKNNGRFSAPGSSVEWQSDWSFSHPERNIALGESYTQYLNELFDSPFNRKLSVVPRGNPQALGTIEKRPAAPTR